MESEWTYTQGRGGLLIPNRAPPAAPASKAEASYIFICRLLVPNAFDPDHDAFGQSSEAQCIVQGRFDVLSMGGR